MKEFLDTLPRWALVGGALLIGLIFILIANPPHTACDSQFEIFKKSETPFLYLDPTKKFDESTQFQKTMQTCKDQNLPGACFQFFEGVRFVIKDLNTVSSECRAKIAGKSEVSTALWSALEFIFNLAWGSAPPKTYYEKTGWLDTSHISIFCNLQKVVRDNSSEDEWTQFREKLLQNLPGAAGVGRAETWNRSLFTLKCP